MNTPREVSRYFDANALDGMSVEDAIKYLQDLPEKVKAGHIDIEMECDQYSYSDKEYPRVYISYRDLETPEEVQQRLEYIEKGKAMRREEYERLKKEFEE